jgi:hypothetical protein
MPLAGATLVLVPAIGCYSAPGDLPYARGAVSTRSISAWQLPGESSQDPLVDPSSEPPTSDEAKGRALTASTVA